MAGIPETIVTKLNRGMTSAVLGVDKGYARIIKHFDIFSRPDAILPRRSVEDGDSSSSTNQIARIIFANNKLYGLSTASGTTQKLFSRDPSDVSDATWDSPSNVNVADVPNGFMFVDYPKTGKLYWSLGSAIASYAYGSATYAASASAITATAQALLHSKDDRLYVPCTNVIAVNNNDSWNTSALTLPAEYTISSLFEYGNYLGIACKPVNGFGRSKVFLWDRDTSQTTVSEVIDWGVGSLECVELIDGVMAGISTVPGFMPRLSFRTWTGGASASEPFLELITSSSSVTSQRIWKQVVNNRLLFNYDITLDGEQCIGVWELGKNADGKWALALGYLYRNDGLGTSDTINGFYLYQEYMFVSYNDGSNGNAVKLSKTDDQANYSITSVFQDIAYATIDGSQTKKLVGVTGMYEPLPSGGVVDYLYRQNRTGSFTTIFTDSSANSLSHSATNVESVEANLGEHKLIESRLTSEGGAVLTGFSFKEEWVDSRAYQP